MPEILDPERKKRQIQLVKSWVAAGCRGTIEAATGFGKTTIAMIAVEGLIANKTLRGDTVQGGIIVPSNYLKGQWEARLEQWGLDGVMKVRTIQSLFSPNAPSDMQVPLLILDEIHGYTAEVFSGVFDKIRYNYVLGLTGTAPEKAEKKLIIDIHCPIVGKVGIQECIENGWVAPFSVFNLGIPLSEEERTQYKKFNASYHKYFAVFQQNFDIAMKCLTSLPYRKAYAAQIRWDPKTVMIHAVNFRRAMSARVDFLYNLKSKQEVALQLFERFPEARILTFSQTTDVADTVAARAQNAVAYHASLSKKERESAISRFRSRECRILTTAKAMDEGADLPDVDLLVVLSGTTSSRQCGQRYGRGIRYIEGKHAIIVELYALGTQDDTWLRKRQKNIPKDRIQWVRSIEEIEADTASRTESSLQATS